MPDDAQPPRRTLTRIRLLLWVLVALSLLGLAALILLRRAPADPPQMSSVASEIQLGGPFILTGADGQPFSSSRLAGKPYAIFFGFTRCGDVCPTTLARLVKLRREAGDEAALNIVFVTIDPNNDGPREVGQYAKLFNSPIIGLTGAPEQIDRVKKQYGIFAQPAAHPTPGMEMEHSSAVLLFDRTGKLAGTIATDENDAAALAKLKRLTA